MTDERLAEIRERCKWKRKIVLSAGEEDDLDDINDLLHALEQARLAERCGGVVNSAQADKDAISNVAEAWREIQTGNPGLASHMWLAYGMRLQMVLDLAVDHVDGKIEYEGESGH